VDRLCSAPLRHIDQLRTIEIAFAGRSRTDMESFVRHSNVQRVSVRVGINRDRTYAHLATRANDSAGYLSSIRDKDLLEHNRIENGQRTMDNLISVYRFEVLIAAVSIRCSS
jgi:hypothetical protein